MSAVARKALEAHAMAVGLGQARFQFGQLRVGIGIQLDHGAFRDLSPGAGAEQARWAVGVRVGGQGQDGGDRSHGGPVVVAHRGRQQCGDGAGGPQPGR
ncbi:MAG: hypothetical protein HY241_02195 [Actinobacteria bacterium]|nr:hypothetical protein [Actinomycetota bacterium]